MSDWKIGETRHMVLDIRGALKWPKRMLRGMLVEAETGRTLTPDEVQDVLMDKLAAGMKVLPMGCPSPNADGTCPGHMSEQGK